MKILITGCCGFIGTNLSLFTMRNTTHKIVGVDSNPFKENLDELQKFSNFEFLNLDIEDIWNSKSHKNFKNFIEKELSII